MTLRTARPEDHGAILALAVDFYAEDGFGTPRELLAEHLTRLLAGGAAHAAVVEEDGQIVAFGISTTSYGLEYGVGAELEDLYVVPAARRRGLAGQLIEDAARWAKGIGAGRLEIVIAPNGADLSHLFDFYRGRGFVDEGRRLLALDL